MLTDSTARAVADRIRAELATRQIVATGKDGSPIIISGRTASVGVALLPEHGDDLDLLRRVADAARYDAKNAGRNCTRVARVESTQVLRDLQQSVCGVVEGDGFLFDSAERGGAGGCDGVVSGGLGFGEVRECHR